MKRNREDLAKGWIRKAESDLAEARRTIDSEGPYDTACFHCQQAAEKFLKAVLAWQGEKIPKTHDIEELILLCAKKSPFFKKFDFPAEELSAYAVEMRYDAEFWPDRGTAEKAFEKVQTLIETTRRELTEKFWRNLDPKNPPQ
jgi:HEPN domain-containing protein